MSRFLSVHMKGRSSNILYSMTIVIGFSGKSVGLARPPGWEADSWGYHSDDGHCYAGQTAGKPYGPSFTASDVIGCGVNFRTGEVFFTKNGVHLGIAFREVGKACSLYPTVGLKKSGEHIRVNFGQTPFFFDIDGMMTVSLESPFSSTPAPTHSGNPAGLLNRSFHIMATLLGGVY